MLRPEIFVPPRRAWRQSSPAHVALVRACQRRQRWAEGSPLARRRRQIKSSNSLGRWRVRSASLSGIRVSSGTRFTRRSHSLMVGSSSRRRIVSTHSTLFFIFFHSVVSCSAARTIEHRRFKKLAKRTKQATIILPARLCVGRPGTHHHGFLRRIGQGSGRF